MLGNRVAICFRAGYLHVKLNEKEQVKEVYYKTLLKIHYSRRRREEKLKRILVTEQIYYVTDIRLIIMLCRCGTNFKEKLHI